MAIPDRMVGVELTGYGGLDMLVYREDLSVPQPGPGEVLINVTAAGVNNTDINTRSGWYSSAVTAGTTAEGGSEGFAVKKDGMGDWAGDIVFPRIQGADCCGRIVAVGEGVDPGRIGARVTIQPYFTAEDDAGGIESAGFLGLDRDGAFAQFVAVPARNVLDVSADLPYSDAEIATISCSGGTAMNMLRLAGVAPGDKVVVTGASGGVGTFLVQIARHLGAEVVAIAGASKADALLALGASTVIDRTSPDQVGQVRAAFSGPATVVADVVGGDAFPDFLAMLGRGGRFVTAGAIAGPMVTLDLRTLYLKSLSFFGSSAYRPDTFPALMEVVRAGALNPPIAGIRPLGEIAAAQEAFLAKSHVGSFVLIPPPVPGVSP